MSVNRKETIGDPNSFKDINYELLIDFRLTVDGYLHNTPPVKEYSWEEFQEELEKIGKNYAVKFTKVETFVDGVTFKEVFRTLVKAPFKGGYLYFPLFVESYFNVLTSNTLKTLIGTVSYLRWEEDRDIKSDEEIKDVGSIPKITMKRNDYETKEITKK